MRTRVALTLLYAIALGAVMALDNLDDLPVIVPLAVWVLAPLIGFFVGRWWVVLAVLGAVVGRTIGWDSSENDGNPALWPPYVTSTAVFIGLPLLLGVAISEMRDRRRQRQAA
jgi:hypothetical protein